MTDKKILAEQDYSNGMKYKDIAKKYGVSLDTVKSWKQRFNWSREKTAHKSCTQKNQKSHGKIF